MTYHAWEATVPDEIRSDCLWKMEAYRLGLFLSDLAWEDSGKVLQERRAVGVADQLYRAAGNISSNTAEGYSRDTGRDRARFYEYALGSSRETRDWYYKSRRALGEEVSAHRLDLTTQLARLLIRMISNERRSNKRLSGSAKPS